MSHSHKTDDILNIRGYQELGLENLSDYPALDACFKTWSLARNGECLPVFVDIEAVPDSVLPYVMLLDYLPLDRDVEVRLSGTYVGERTRESKEGRRLKDFFNEHDSEVVFVSMQKVADTRTPSLARRSYVSLEGRYLEYVRLILPLSADGITVTGFFKTIEPNSLTMREMNDAG